MLNPGIVYMLASVVLSAVAVVVHFHVSHLALPLSPATTCLAVILPIAAFLNAYIYPNLLRASHAAHPAPGPAARFAPALLQGLQAVLAAVLATLLLRGLVPSPVLDFLLDARWDALFEARDAARIALVQDTFACCGLDALDDRAYPFDAADTPCAALYRRHRPCKGPWMSAMQATSALDFAVVLTVGLMQILGLLLMRDRTGWWTALRTQGWKQAELGDDGSSQHLLPDPDNDDDGYGAVPHLKPAPAAAPERHADNR